MAHVNCFLIQCYCCTFLTKERLTIIFLKLLLLEIKRNTIKNLPLNISKIFYLLALNTGQINYWSFNLVISCNILLNFDILCIISNLFFEKSEFYCFFDTLKLNNIYFFIFHQFL